MPATGPQPFAVTPDSSATRRTRAGAHCTPAEFQCAGRGRHARTDAEEARRRRSVRAQTPLGHGAAREQHVGSPYRHTEMTVRHIRQWVCLRKSSTARRAALPAEGCSGHCSSGSAVLSSRPNAVGLRHRGGRPLARRAHQRSRRRRRRRLQLVDGRELSRGLLDLSGHEILRDAGKAAVARQREYPAAAGRTA